MGWIESEVDMPIHDWTRVSAGTWHAFHLAWIAEIQATLNDGVLPPDHYALAEQIVGPLGPDVLTLQESDPPNEVTESRETSANGDLVLATAPLTMLITADATM